MEEGYIPPEHFLISVATSVLIGLIMNASMKAGQTEGRQTMFGIPKTDVERLMSHYGISEEEAAGLLATYPVDLLIPERGSGLAPGEIVGHSQAELASGLMMMEDSLNVGEKARITLCSESLPTDDDLADMYLDMVNLGCHVSYPTGRFIDGIPTTEFVLEKGSPAWPLLIPLIVPALIIGLISFGILRIESIARALVPILLITISGVIIIAAVLSKPAGKYIERGGKIPLLASTKPHSELESKVKSAWAKACEWEKISPESKFVVFSDDNPYLKEYNEGIKQLLRFREFQAGEWKPAVTKSKKALAVR